MAQTEEQEMDLKIPPQQQDQQPGIEAEMTPAPIYLSESYKAAGKLAGKVALVTGGDSGIGRAVAVLFAHEGADVAIAYLSEDEDAKVVKAEVEKVGRKCLLLPGDVGVKAHAKEVVEKTVAEFGKLDILVNNAAEQHTQDDILDISEEQLSSTFRTNIFAYFFMVQAALPHLKEGAKIINTTSVTAYEGSPQLLDYSSTKGAILAFTRSLSQALIEKGIRVNGVAPGPIWTPFIPSTMPKDKVAKFGEDTPMKRAGQPFEVGTCYVFLASDDSSYIAGQTLHPNGGEVVNG
ncbi:general stress protein 39 [Abditibacteriota bacterium]|nr:general stress protein 39 [Abditibacteriota bacterium]